MWCGPARKGDILQAVRGDHCSQIVLIDGRFHQTPSVWHKEIIYALVNGVRVIGASSMGALRAAECWRYGMIGIGKIFERYRDGETDDSWVAMTYDPETGRPLREAPCGGKQKLLDALEAIRYSRENKDPFNCKLKKEEVEPLLWRMMTVET